MFKLSRVLGNREAVLESPAAEIFKFMDMELERERQEAERERQRYWLNFLVNLYSQIPQGQEKPEFTAARKEFINALKPAKELKATKDQKQKPKGLGGWNIPPEEIERLEREGKLIPITDDTRKRKR